MNDQSRNRMDASQLVSIPYFLIIFLGGRRFLNQNKKASHHNRQYFRREQRWKDKAGDAREDRLEPTDYWLDAEKCNGWGRRQAKLSYNRWLYWERDCIQIHEVWVESSPYESHVVENVHQSESWISNTALYLWYHQEDLNPWHPKRDWRGRGRRKSVAFYSHAELLLKNSLEPYLDWSSDLHRDLYAIFNVLYWQSFRDKLEVWSSSEYTFHNRHFH